MNTDATATIERLALAIERQTPAPATATEKFTDTLEKSARGDGHKRLDWPSEILTPHTDARIRGGRWTPAGPGTLAAILAGTKLCDAQTATELKKLEADYSELYDKQGAFTLKAANTIFENQRRVLHENVAGGKIPGPNETVLRGRADIQEDFLAKHSAIGAVLSKIARQACGIALPILERAVEAVSNSMQETENSERGTALKFDVAWLPSAAYRAHATVLMQLRKRIEALKRFRAGAFGYSHCAPHFAVENLVTI